MTFNMEFIALLTCAVMTLVLHSRAVCPPPPTKLTYRWLDPFTVNVSWERPSGLQDVTEVKYKYSLVKNGEDKAVVGTKLRNFTDTCLTEETDSDRWTYSVWTDNPKCDRSKKNITFTNDKPRAKVVEDFKCVIDGNETDCSWIPVDPSLTLKLSYRICGHYEEVFKGLKECREFSRSGTRTGCRVKIDITKGDICICVETDAGMSTFKAKLEVLPPELSVREEGNHLNLSWNCPNIGKKCNWLYEICYSRCSSHQCLNISVSDGQKCWTTVPYDNRCLYGFQAKVTTDYCKKISSDFSEVVPYGTNKPPDRTLTVVAIVVPTILSVCVLLSCYCFRRHSAIICPNIPDPSAIFKEMMMNGNKEPKIAGSLYTPVPEPIEPCRIASITESSVLQQNV